MTERKLIALAILLKDKDWSLIGLESQYITIWTSKEYITYRLMFKPNGEAYATSGKYFRKGIGRLERQAARNAALTDMNKRAKIKDAK